MDQETVAGPDEVVDAVGFADPTGVPSGAELLEALTRPLLHASAVGKETVALTAELLRIGIGRSDVEPDKRDARFRDPAWVENPLYHRLVQSYLAACRTVDNLVEDADGDDWRQREKTRFATGVLTSALAPTNVLVGNPAALKRALDTGGRSVVRGLGNFVHDLRHNGGMPSMAKPGALKVAEDLAVTPGSVVTRDEVAELIQYAPATDTVHERPTLIVPPPIGRYYFLDLAPGRSFVEYAVSRGLQTFVMSWRNPTPEQAGWDMETYARRIVDAIEEVKEITGSADVNVIGFCAGGILTTTVLNHLAARGDPSVHSASFAVTLLDFGVDAPIGAFSSPRLLSLARWSSGREGVITAKAMGSVFSWMRPNELVWNYWINNYLMGQDPPVFDILAWNADGTNLPSSLHRQFLEIFGRNHLVDPGELTVLGDPVDLNRIKVPVFVLGAVNDHLTPWQGTYRTVQLLGGEPTFVLSNAGHIASLVNPPGNPKSSYFLGDTDPQQSAADWLAAARKETGSWWERWTDWTMERAGERRKAPRRVGSRKHPPLDPAPGRYVRDLPVPSDR
jgi:polyhydroxyalkanoate synthase